MGMESAVEGKSLALQATIRDSADTRGVDSGRE